MPWSIEQGHGCPADKPWAVVGPNGRKGCHPTEAAAREQQKALYANVKEGAIEMPDLDAIAAALREAGSRGDPAIYQSVHDAAVRLGAACTAHAHGEPTIEVAEAVSAEPITFRESGVEAITFGPAAFVTLAEAAATFDDEKREVWITPIKPGFGNPRDKFFYPRDAIREGVDGGLFDGRKMYANHPRRSDEKDLPERSVRDWIATVKETVWDDQRDMPRSRVKVYDPDVYQRWKDAPDEIAFSILGGGSARPGKVNGRDARIVESFKNIRSIDWVTEAGAGGAIDFAESANEEYEMDLKNLTPEQIKDARPDLWKAIREAEGDGDGQPAEGEAPAAGEQHGTLPGSPENGPAPQAPSAGDDGRGITTETTTTTTTPAGGEPAGGAPEGYVSRDEFEALRQEVVQRRMQEAVASNRADTRKFVESLVKQTTLPSVAREAVFERFAEATTGEGMLFPTKEGLKAAVDKEIGILVKVQDQLTGRRSTVTGLGGKTDAEPVNARESMEQRLDSRLGREALPAAKSADDDDTAKVAEAKRGTSVEDRLAARF